MLVLLSTQAMQAAGVTPQQLQMVLQQRISLSTIVQPLSATAAVQSPSRLPNAAVQGSAGTRPSFASAFTKSLSASPNLAAFKAPLPPPNAAPLPRAEKRKYETLRSV